MQHTLLAVFGNRTDAQNAMRALTSSGFPREQVQLSNADPTGMSDSTTGHGAGAPGGSSEGGSVANLGRVFTELFGADNSIHAGKYVGAVTRGHHVLIVRAGSLQEAERAADIVERFGPDNTDEQVSQAGAMGAGTDRLPEAPRTSGAGSMQRAAQAPPASTRSPSRAILGSTRHLDNPGDPRYFQQHSLNRSEPTGGTYQEPMGESGLGATGATSLHGSILRENAAHVFSLEDAGTGSPPAGAAPEVARLTETRHGRSRIYSMEDAPAEGGSGLDIGSNPFGDDDDYYRNHFLANYSDEDYERVKPAYSYGAEMRKSALYRYRPWDDVEGDLARAWDARTGAVMQAAWSRVKAAVRHGWERITAHDDDREFRSHWQRHYGTAAGAASYDEVRPAYDYGAAMARDDRYRGRAWPAVERDLRTEWEQRHGGGDRSTWENMEPAVRHAWDRVRS